MNAGSGSTSPSGDRDLLVLCPPVGPSMRTECQHIPADWKRTPILEDRREPVSLGWTGRAGGVDLRITTERRLQSVSSAGKACEFYGRAAPRGPASLAVSGARDLAGQALHLALATDLSLHGLGTRELAIGTLGLVAETVTSSGSG